MRKKFVHKAVLIILLLSHFCICPATKTSEATDPNRYLNTISIFADNVLKYGRDTYSFITP